MRKRTEGRSVLHRAVTLVLTLSMLLGLLPVQLLTHDASAHWAQGALDKLVDIGVMRGDSGGLRPDANITRAEFVAMINRAYGYEKGGTHPFSDVPPESWYAEDIAIAYNTGYFKGTAANIASPNGSLTREEAVVMLGRNMMMQEKGGEAMTYADGREFSNWSRGYIETASSLGLVNGYADGTFRARNNVTRAEVATMLSNALGTVLNDGGEYTLGGVYGNVTINTNGTKLKDSVIAGDLYVTGGLDKGYATLENVTVLGRIIVSGGGEGNEGNNSVLLRNVDADTVIVDRFDDQFITLRAEGVTTIGDVDVRTSAFLKDVTPTGYGFLNIGFNADSGSTLDISGNIEKVTNFTPQSVLKLAKGSAQDITVDEAARESELIVDSGAVAYNMNLDTATNVDGLGSITKLNVAAPGSEAAILPDYIYIRPGITADINGEEMNSQAADQASEDPRLLSGYGAARNIAPTSFDAVFAANKRGTVYWAVTSVGDGSLDADELITPPTYATVIIKNGSVQTTAAGREVTSKVSGLTKGGTYYLSAVFVDERGMES
ncbi:MAG: S-layer homology domain-containing protein, partial [Oscillospiraceae bacterium]|nr:S-layer homology domain-containing protein [Oscillospiraceae bacterium]